MCIDSDLFGDVIVLKSDVLLFLSQISIMSNTRSKSQREYYVKNNDVVNKIKLMKLNDTFNNFVQVETYDNESLDIFEPRYVQAIDEKKPPCSDGFHICNNLQCSIYKKRIAHEKNHAKYMRHKLARLKATA